jgi:hypothetical protein
MAEIENLTKNRNMIIVTIVVFLMIGLLLYLGLRGGSSSKPEQKVDTGSVVTVKSDSVNLSLDGNNNLSIKTPTDLFTGEWTGEKTSAFLAYLLENGSTTFIQGGYVVTVTVDGVTTTLYFSDNDELIQTIIDDTSGDDDSDSDGDNGGDDIGEIFGSTPTPTPAATTVATPTPTDDGDDVGGPGEDYGHPECALWRLSYCADPLPTPTATPTQPVEDGVFLESYCDAWNELGIGSTIITNTVCVE